MPWSYYASALLSLVGIGLVLTKGRVASIPLLVAAVLVLLPIGLVVLSVPSLGAYLVAALAGGPSALAGLAALAVKGKSRPAPPTRASATDGQSTPPLAADPGGSTTKRGAAGDKRLWVGGLTAA